MEQVCALVLSSSSVQPALTLLLFLAGTYVFLVWPFRVASRIGAEKGRRGWLYPLIGLICLFSIGGWIGVLVLSLRAPRRGFSTRPAPLYIPPSPEKAVFRDDEPKAPSYVAPKRCPECRGRVPQTSPFCGHCGHTFRPALTTP
jgi:hypothetical protein